MNKIIIGLLVGILSINIYGFVFKDSSFLELDVPRKTFEDCVNLNEVETFSCLKELEALGYSTGNDLMLLGQLYLYGIGTEIDVNQARDMFEKSVIVDQNINAMRLLGDLAVNNDLLSAKYWYSRASQKNDLDAAAKLASIYRYGDEKDLDLDAALLLYKQIADSGSLDAHYEIALMYATGEGVEPNISQSLFMLGGSCEKGHALSCDLLQQIQRLRANRNGG